MKGKRCEPAEDQAKTQNNVLMQDTGGVKDAVKTQPLTSESAVGISKDKVDNTGKEIIPCRSNIPYYCQKWLCTLEVNNIMKGFWKKCIYLKLGV